VQEPKIQEVDDIEAVPVEEHNVIFKPNAGPQTEFLAAGEREVLYGGSADGVYVTASIVIIIRSVICTCKPI
jgi:hypothetical protein